MNKKILAALTLITASSTQAAFDQGNAVFFAYNGANDNTYFVDLGITAGDIFNGVEYSVTDSGLASFLAANAGAQWSVIGTDITVAGPPTSDVGLCGCGLPGYISTSNNGIKVGVSGPYDHIQQAIMRDWIADVQAASGGASSFGVAGTDPVSADAARNGGFFEQSLNIFGSQAGLFIALPSGVSFAEDAVVTQVGYASLTQQSIYINSVPIPATAWLFGSGLVGLATLKLKKTK